MRILIAGTGAIADEFEKYISDDVEIIAHIETNPREMFHKGRRVYNYTEINTVLYDKIIVANIYSDEIKMVIKELNLDINKFIFLRPWTDIGVEEGNLLFHWNELYCIAPEYMKEKLNCSRRYFIANRMWLDDVKDSVLSKYKVQQRDYFRYRTFEMVAEQIKELDGAVAELGVFQGEFAQVINATFTDKKLYLFDTFQSFDDKEYEKEKNKGNCEEGFDRIFRYTSIQRVLNRMPFPEKCIVKQGLFPATAEGLDEKFVFVSIDVDFEDSIFEGICWFYPRMDCGGIIFIHDYNNNKLFGVKKAIEKYEKEYGKLIKLPLGDWGGTLVIIKQ